jgi:hypothetical protein
MLETRKEVASRSGAQTNIHHSTIFVRKFFRGEWLNETKILVDRSNRAPTGVGSGGM